jgi:hypothetical protein
LRRLSSQRIPTASPSTSTTELRTIFGITVVVVAAALLLAARLLPEQKGDPVAWRDLSAQVGPLELDASQHPLFREHSKLAQYLRRAGARRSAPRVDFSRRQLLLVSPGPRSSTGYEVQIVSVREQGGKITVRIRERAPRLGEPVEARVTYPYRLLSLPAGDDVYVDWIGR